jgi:hypothetical protein
MHKFDWNSNSITRVDSQWDLERLMMTLVIPTIDYFVPILAKIEFPEYLTENPEIWKSVFKEFSPQYKQAISNLHEWTENDFYPAYNQARKIHEESNPTPSETREFANRFYQKHEFSDFYTYLKIWKMFLEMLSDKTSKSVAIEVERWIYRHRLSTRCWSGAHEWWYVIVRYQECPDDSAPDFFMSRASEIYQEINRSNLLDFYDMWEPLYYEKYDIEYEQGGIHSSYLADSDVFTHAFVNIRVSKMLQTFAQSLTEEQIILLTDWAKRIAYRSGDPSFDYGHELILADIPFTNFPSILNVENLKQSITFCEAEQTHILQLK